MFQNAVESLSIRQSSASQADAKIMLFEMAIYGHHAVYIRHLVRYWCEQAMSGHFYIVVTAQFVAERAEIVEIAQQYPAARVSFLPLTASEEAALTTNLSSFVRRKLRAWQEWNLMCAYAKKLQATHCFLASFDFFQWPFLLAQKPPCPISSIYFKPTFHYASFPGYVPTLKSRIQQQTERTMLSIILRQPHLHRLLCLDPLAAEVLNQDNQNKVIALADPVETYPLRASPNLRERLNIEAHRKVFLLFGDLTGRKGVEQVLEAIALLPSTLCQDLCFLLAGRCSPDKELRFHSKIVQVTSVKPVQVIERYGFVSQQEMQNYFQVADVVLAPYQQHVGMSGILLQAAAAQKPVLSSNYGLMGELVRRHQLGLAVESTQPTELANALSLFLQKPVDSLYDPKKTKQFAEDNNVEKFANTILQAVRDQQ